MALLVVALVPSLPLVATDFDVVVIFGSFLFVLRSVLLFIIC